MPERLNAAQMSGLLVLGIALLAGCACKHCDTERERALLERGEPLDREIERDGTLFTETWYYWQDNETVVFFWNEQECSCEMSIYEVDGSQERAMLDNEFDSFDGELTEQLKEHHFSTSRSTPFAP